MDGLGGQPRDNGVGSGSQMNGARPAAERVLLLNQLFYPDCAATAQILTDLAEDLARRGAAVTAIAGRWDYRGRERFSKREDHRGITIRRVPGTNFGRGRLAGRAVDFASFFAMAAARLFTLPRPDLVLALSTPPLISLLGLAAQRLRGSKFVYWVQDLYPDVAVALGALGPRSPITKFASRLSNLTLRRADAVVAIGDEMARRLLVKGVDPARLHVIHNWSDGAAISELPEGENWFLDRHGLRGKFVVEYSGNMGRAHEFETLFAAAERLKERQDVLFLFIGDGVRRGEVEAAAARLPNIKVLPYQRREDLPYSIGAADLCVISLRDGLEGLVVPSKLYGCMAAAKPIAFVGPSRSEVAQVVAETGAGSVFHVGDDAGLAELIGRCAEDRGEATAMGERGRAAYLTKYDRPLATARFACLCEDLCGGGRQPA